MQTLESDWKRDHAHADHTREDLFDRLHKVLPRLQLLALDLFPHLDVQFVFFHSLFKIGGDYVFGRQV